MERHHNAEKPWERSTNIRKGNDKRVLREGETSPLPEIGSSRCIDCGNRSHAGQCWPCWDDCGKRHRPGPERCQGRPKYNLFPPPQAKGSYRYQTRVTNIGTSKTCGRCGKLHHDKCKYLDTDKCSTCHSFHFGTCRDLTIAPQAPPATGSNCPGARKSVHDITITGPGIWALSKSDARKRTKWQTFYNDALKGLGIDIVKVTLDPKFPIERNLRCETEKSLGQTKEAILDRL